MNDPGSFRRGAAEEVDREAALPGLYRMDAETKGAGRRNKRQRRMVANGLRERSAAG